MIQFLAAPRYAYFTLVVDPFLGIATGASLGIIATKKEEDKLHDLFVLMVAGMCVLTKDVGIFFSVFQIIAFLIYKSDKRENDVKKIMSGIAAIVIPKYLWSWNLASNGVEKTFLIR